MRRFTRQGKAVVPPGAILHTQQQHRQKYISRRCKCQPSIRPPSCWRWRRACRRPSSSCRRRRKTRFEAPGCSSAGCLRAAERAGGRATGTTVSILARCCPRKDSSMGLRCRGCAPRQLRWPQASKHRDSAPQQQDSSVGRSLMTAPRSIASPAFSWMDVKMRAAAPAVLSP